MNGIIAFIGTVWRWIRNARVAPLFAAVLFALLIGILGQHFGLRVDDILRIVVVIIVLGFGVWGLNNLFASEPLRQFISWSLALLFVIASFAIVLGIVWQILFPKEVIQRGKYETQFIDHACGPPSDMLTPKNLGIGASDDEKEAAGLNKVWEWVRDGLEGYRYPIGGDGKPTTDKSQLAVILRSKSRFIRYYSDIHGTITLKSHIKIEEGVAFLISYAGGRPVYRQMHCKCDITSEKNGGDFTLVEPNPGEELFMILRLRHREGKALDGDCGSFGISLEVTQ